jgi:hypothetical protein
MFDNNELDDLTLNRRSPGDAGGGYGLGRFGVKPAGAFTRVFGKLSLGGVDAREIAK